VLGIVAVLILLLVVRPLLGRILDGFAGPGSTRSRLLAHGRQAQAALAAPGGNVPALANSTDPLAAEGGSDPEGGKQELMIDLNKVDGRVRVSSIRKIGDIVEKHPEEAVAIVRNWLYQDT
jgi:flagellar M-ring protein FliF